MSVLRAKQDLPKGHHLRASDLGYMRIHKNYVNAQYISIYDRDAIAGSVLTVDLQAGSPILQVFLETEEKSQPLPLIQKEAALRAMDQIVRAHSPLDLPCDAWQPTGSVLNSPFESGT
ncbi:MAG: SAF domain-containing protein [Kiritimatiellae bacterium]|nr:SAF domain-containing protein [Kiritimatiellia bacterium]